MAYSFDEDEDTFLEDPDSHRSPLRTPSPPSLASDPEPVPPLLPIHDINNPTQPSDDSGEIAFDMTEWLVADSSSGKKRHPRQKEFLELLLENPRYNSYITWLDKDQGLFQILEPDKVATLWTKVKFRQTNATMDYNTFARGVRYYYTNGSMIKTNKKFTFCFKRSKE